jgi:hypothetical protein
MAFYRGPNIVTNGLVLSLDAANTKSYPGSGTVIGSLTGGNLSGSLLNGASFDTTYGGSINLDGVDDALNIQYFNLSSQSFAVDIWYQPGQNTENLRGIISCADLWSGPPSPGWGIGFSLSNNNALNYGIIDSDRNIKIRPGTVIIEANKPHNISLVRNNITQTCNFYVNGDLKRSDHLPVSCSLSGNRTVISSATWLYSPAALGKIFSVKIYDSVNLSNEDVFRNYNAQKSRFGL